MKQSFISPSPPQPSNIQQTMALQSFYLFNNLPAELRLQCWQQAICNEGPRIVEVTGCQVDHSKDKCYIASHCGLHWQSDCCLHRQNPLIHPTTAPCRCIRWHESPPPRRCNCLVCRSLTENMVSNTKGHVAGGAFHMCRRTNSKLSPLRTCSESRYKVQRLGILKYI